MHNGSIIYQTVRRLEELKAFGVSKLAVRKEIAAQTGRPLKDVQSQKIHSIETWKTYRRWALSAVSWLREALGIRRLDQVTPQHAAEYIMYLAKDRKYSPYSLATVRSALAKLLGVSGRVIADLPRRQLSDIRRSRLPAKMDKDFSRTGKYRPFVQFADATGLRMSELREVEVKDISIRKDGTVFVRVRRGKNGQSRDVEVLKGHESAVLRVCDEALRRRGSSNPRLFDWVPKKVKFDAHAARAGYAWKLYKQFENLNRPREYLLLRRNGEVFDKIALLRVSENLGHHRMDVVTKHYMWNRT